MLNRTLTLAIQADLAVFPVIILVGPRQCGKTTLAKYLIQPIDRRPVHYLDTESEEDAYRLENAESYLKEFEDSLVIIDEVQRMPRLMPLLRSLIDKARKPGRFILLGSASPILLQTATESLQGRSALHELGGISFAEAQEAAILLPHLWFTGGFPSAVLAADQTAASQWLGQYIRNFIERDVRILYGLDMAPELLRRLLIMLAHTNGQVSNISQLSGSLGITSHTLQKCINVLQGAYWIRRLAPYYVNIGKRLVKSPKYYYRDTGLLHRLLGLNSHDAVQAHPIAGSSWEGFVIEQIALALNPDWQIYFYRTQTGVETDLVLIAPDQTLYCIEIKLSNTPILSKGFYQALDDLKPAMTAVITSTGAPFKKNESVWICGLAEFLSSILPQWR
jgi:uncharacterized protein